MKRLKKLLTFTVLMALGYTLSCQSVDRTKRNYERHHNTRNTSMQRDNNTNFYATEKTEKKVLDDKFTTIEYDCPDEFFSKDKFNELEKRYNAQEVHLHKDYAGNLLAWHIYENSKDDFIKDRKAYLIRNFDENGLKAYFGIYEDHEFVIIEIDKKTSVLNLDVLDFYAAKGDMGRTQFRETYPIHIFKLKKGEPNKDFYMKNGKKNYITRCEPNDEDNVYIDDMVFINLKPDDSL